MHFPFKKIKSRSNLQSSFLILLGVFVFISPWKAIAAEPVSTSTATVSATEASSTLLFIGNQSRVPIFFLRGTEPTGVAVDITREIAKHLSQPIEIKAMDWTEAQKLVSGGGADALVYINPTEERKSTYEFSDPLLESRLVIFTESKTVGISGATSLRGLRVGVESESLPEKILGADPEIKISTFPNIIDGFNQLAVGNLEAVVVDYRIGAYLLAENDVQNIKVSGDPIALVYPTFAVKKGNTKLLNEINAALKTIKTDGTYQKVLDNWASSNVIFQTQQQATREVYVGVIAALLILFLVALAWSISIGKELSKRKESEEKFRKINESAQDAIIMMGPDGEIVSWNKAAEQIFGYTKEEVRGKKVHSIIAGTQSEAIALRALPHFFRTGEGPIVGKIRKVTALRKNGEEFTAELSVSSTQISGKWHAIGIVRDIEEVEKTDKALRESEARLAEAQHMTNLGNWELDLVKNVLIWSAEIYHIFEIDPEKFGASYEAFLNAIHPDDRDRVNNAYTDSVKTHIPYDIDHRLLMEDGRIKYVHERCETFYDENGKAIRSVGTVQDITDRKKTEEALRVASAYNRSLIEAALDPMVTISPEGKITDVNDATEAVTGYSQEELVGKDFSDYFTNPEKAKAGYREVFSTGMVRDYELEIRHKDGHLTPVLYNATLYRDEDGKAIGVFAAARDITDRKKAEEALSKINRTLRMLSTTNEALIHTTDEAELHYKICDIVVNKGGYRMAWIGHVEHDEAKSVRPVGQAGFEGGYIDSLKTTWAENGGGCSPEGDAVRTKEVVIIRDIETDPSMSSCRVEALKRGYRSLIVFPLINGNGVFAIFSIYAETTDAFDEDTVSILREMTDDMAFGVTSIHIRSERDAAEKEIRAHAKYMESMDKVNRAILGANELEKMMSDVLDVVLSVFDCDRAWLITPSDPWTLSYRVPMERTKPKYPGASSLGITVPVDPDTTILFQKVRATEDPVVFNSESEPPLPSEITKRFQVQSQLVMDIYPKTGDTWMIGMHQCSYERIWTDEEKKLFQEIGRRISDALTSLLISQDLEKSEEEYRTLIQKIQAAVVVHDADTKIITSNAIAQDLLGLTEDQLLGKAAYDPTWNFYLENGNVAPQSEYPVNIAFRTKAPLRNHALRVHRPNKEQDVWVLINADPIFNEQNEITQVIVTFVDITELKITEEKLKEQQRHSQSLLHFSRKVEQSQTYGEILGAAQDEIKNILGYASVWAYIIDEKKEYAHSIAAVGSISQEVMSSKGTATLTIKGDPMLEAIANAKEIIIVADAQTDPNVNKEIVAKLKNRTIVNVPIILFDRNLGSIGMGTFGDEGVRVPTQSEQEFLIAMASHMAVGFDRIHLLDEREKTEDVLREQKTEVEIEKTKDEALLQSLGEGMIAVDNDGNVLAINKAAEKMIGWKEAEILNKNIVDVLPILDENNTIVPREKRIFREAIEARKTTEAATLSYVRRDGKAIPVAVTATPFILNNETIGAVNVFRDITEERRLEETRRDLLSLASHQLRTPLSGTKWLIETLQKGVKGPLNKDQAEYLNEIYKINERMTTLVHDMLGVLRMESGISSKAEQFPASTAITGVLGALGATATSKNVTLRSVFEKDHSITSDPLLLQNILEVIVSNAITYSPSGTEVTVSFEERPEELVFAVKDSGIGIPLDEQSHIFERFYRAVNAKTFDTRGTGLGLYIASMLAKKLGMTLSFESEEGKGTTFYIHIPNTKNGVLPEKTTNV